ncbi:GD13967 [Drosophila simulans]|uniref:GD13967 n=2 Tax=Drosophila simulans TaxID=7240 RepID=B4NVP1_DROSI|nr:GD13967 [Drosophila simulans]
MQQKQPSTMDCYATPVWRSTPSATPTSRPPSGSLGGSASATAPIAVKDLRQGLQNSPQFHPNQLTSTRNQRQILQVLPPPYTQRSQVRGQRRRSFECLDGAASLAAMEHMDSGSDHSGGSDVTVQIADVIDYADA